MSQAPEVISVVVTQDPKTKEIVAEFRIEYDDLSNVDLITVGQNKWRRSGNEIKPWCPNPDAVAAIDQAINLANLLPNVPERTRLLSMAATMWVCNNAVGFRIEVPENP